MSPSVGQWHSSSFNMVIPNFHALGCHGSRTVQRPFELDLRVCVASLSLVVSLCIVHHANVPRAHKHIKAQCGGDVREYKRNHYCKCRQLRSKSMSSMWRFSSSNLSDALFALALASCMASLSCCRRAPPLLPTRGMLGRSLETGRARLSLHEQSQQKNPLEADGAFQLEFACVSLPVFATAPPRCLPMTW